MKVAVAIIPDHKNRILITQRPLHASHGGCWEFPGGKLEDNELPEDALIREIKEEVGLTIIEYDVLGEIKYQYPHHFVHLFVFYINKYQGTPLCLEGQLNMKWIAKSDLNSHAFPEANHEVFKLIPEKILAI